MLWPLLIYTVYVLKPILYYTVYVLWPLLYCTVHVHVHVHVPILGGFTQPSPAQCPAQGRWTLIGTSTWWLEPGNKSLKTAQSGMQCFLSVRKIRENNHPSTKMENNSIFKYPLMRKKKFIVSFEMLSHSLFWKRSQLVDKSFL